MTETESTITSALVERVSQRLATGVPIELALAGEPAGRAEYEEHLRRNPDLAAIQEVAKREFLQCAIGRLLSARDSSANIRWLLERLHPDIFASGRDNVTVNVAAVAGIPEHYVKRIQEDAKKL